MRASAGRASFDAFLYPFGPVGPSESFRRVGDERMRMRELGGRPAGARSRRSAIGVIVMACLFTATAARAADTPAPRIVPEALMADLQARPAPTTQQRQLSTALERKLSASQRARLQSSIAAVRAVLAGKLKGDPEVLAAQGARAGFPGASAADTDALTFIVLTEAAAGAEGDLKTTAARIQSETASKQQLREQLSATDSATAASETVKQQGSLNAQLNTMNDLSETQAMQLQLAMDQRSKLLAALSNLQKSIEDAQQAILQNLKS